MAANWKQCAEFFADKEVERDFFIFDTTEEHWRRLFDLIKSHPAWGPFVDEKPVKLPEFGPSLFVEDPEKRYFFAITIHENMVVLIWLSSVDWIEMDINVDEVKGPEGLKMVLDFMATLGKALQMNFSLGYDTSQPEDSAQIEYEAATGKFFYLEGNVP